MDRINADLLRTFLEVASLEHLGRAAEVLQTDQSTISRKIARLEEEIGVPLFERIGRNIRLTQAGRRMVGRAERLLHDMRDAIVEAKGALSPEAGQVHIGFLHHVGAHWLPDRLARFLETYPRVRFILRAGTTAEVASGVLSGDLDLGILGPPPTNVPELEIVPLFRERIAVVVPIVHPFAKRTSCTLADIGNEPLILPRSRSGLRKIIDDAFARQGLVENVAYEGDDGTIILSLVEAGLCITLAPVPLPSTTTKAVAIPLRDPPLARTMALCWDRRRILPPAASLFAQRLTTDSG